MTHETLGNAKSPATFRAHMKRLAVILSAIVLGFTACEQKPASELPEHYKHKAGIHEGGEHDAAADAKHATDVKHPEPGKPAGGEKHDAKPAHP